jgi:hypothetical protein
MKLMTTALIATAMLAGCAFDEPPTPVTAIPVDACEFWTSAAPPATAIQSFVNESGEFVRRLHYPNRVQTFVQKPGRCEIHFAQR